MKTSKIVGVLAAVTLTVVTLSGCSALTQITQAESKISACATISVEVANVGTKLSGLAEQLRTDPKAGAKEFATIAQKFATTASKISNPEVKTVSVAAAKALTKFSDDLTAIADNPSVATQSTITVDGQAVQDALTQVGKVCTPK